MPSSRPSKPRCSVVVALTDTRSSSTPIAPAIARRMASMCGRNPGLLGADRAVHVPDLVALFAQQFRHAAQQDLRVDARKIDRRVGKVQPDVAQRRGAQQSVAQGVDRHVSVRVGDAPFRVGDLHASQNQRQAVGQSVYVVSVSYSEIHSFLYFILSKLRIFS